MPTTGDTKLYKVFLRRGKDKKEVFTQAGSSAQARRFAEFRHRGWGAYRATIA